MLPFKSFLLRERFVNLHKPEHEAAKHAHADEVYGMLHKAYEPIGGLHGNGFKDKHDMVKSIPFWKLHKKNGKVNAVSMHKDKSGRKLVAFATDGSHEGKAAAAEMVRHDVQHKRSYSEISGPAIGFHKKQIGDLTKHAIKPHHVKSLMPDDEIRKVPEGDAEVARHPELKNHFYQRKIGGEWHTKLAIGSAHKTIK